MSFQFVEQILSSMSSLFDLPVLQTAGGFFLTTFFSPPFFWACCFRACRWSWGLPSSQQRGQFTPVQKLRIAERVLISSFELL
jgi:hypothetical protein